MLSALEREGRYRRSFLRSLHQLAARRAERHRGRPERRALAELLEYLAAHSREPTLQKKAGVVFERLRGSAGGELEAAAGSGATRRRGRTNLASDRSRRGRSVAAASRSD